MQAKITKDELQGKAVRWLSDTTSIKLVILRPAKMPPLHLCRCWRRDAFQYQTGVVGVGVAAGTCE